MQLLSNYGPADKKQGRCLVAPASGLPVHHSPLSLVYIELQPAANGNGWLWAVMCRGGWVAFSARKTVFEAAAAAFGKAREFVRADRLSVVVLP